MLLDKITPQKAAKMVRLSAKETGCTINEMCLRIGISRNALSTWTRGLNMPTVASLHKVVKALKIAGIR